MSSLVCKPISDVLSQAYFAQTAGSFFSESTSLSLRDEPPRPILRLLP